MNSWRGQVSNMTFQSGTFPSAASPFFDVSLAGPNTLGSTKSQQKERPGRVFT